MSTGTGQDAGTDPAADGDASAVTPFGEADDTPGGTGRGVRIRRAALSLPVLLLLAAVVFVALGVVFQVRHHSGSTSSPNVALADSAATSQVSGQVQTALNQVLSYDYTNPAPTEQAAQQNLVGDAAKQYQTLFNDLKAKAPGAQLTLKADVGQVGVISLEGHTAQLLVFLNQTSTRAGDKATTGPQPAQLRITATYVGDRWKISELQTR